MIKYFSTLNCLYHGNNALLVSMGLVWSEVSLNGQAKRLGVGKEVCDGQAKGCRWLFPMIIRTGFELPTIS